MRKCTSMKEIKVLFIANSFGDDTTYFMPYIAKDFDVKLVTANLYIGGCEVFKHLNNIRNDLKAYEYRLFDNDNMTWTNRNDVSIKEALLERKWDYIVLQEASHLSGVKDTYKLVPELILENSKTLNYTEYHLLKPHRENMM